VRLLLIRHGQTPANVRGELATRAPGTGLTPLGDRQAAAIVEALADRDIDAIFVSPLVRTHLTAAPLAAARALVPVELTGLREVEAGDLEDRSDEASVEEYQAVFGSWAAGDLSVPMPGAPDGAAFFDRFDAAVRTILDSGATTPVAVSHGAAIRAWVGGRAGNIDSGFMRANRLRNTGMVEVDGDFETGWTCVGWTSDPAGGEKLADPTAQDPTGGRVPASS
jgi:broad specificity phosphatase PhoE